MLDPKAILAFVTIAEERSFSRAAEKLGIVQSVASKRLRRLEDQIGAKLVDRSQRSNIRLTRSGQILLPQMRDVLTHLRTAQIAGLNLARGRAGPLRIGFIFSAALDGTLPRILSLLRNAFPDLILRPKLMETPEQIAELGNGGIDVGLIRPRPSYPDGCTARIVHREAMMACLSLNHPLAQLSSLSPSQISGHRFILPQFDEDVGLVDNVRGLARAGKVAMPELIRTEDYVTAACLASTGDGIVLAPASLANLSLDGVCFRPFKQFEERLQTVMILRDDAPIEAANALARYATDQSELAGEL